MVRHSAAKIQHSNNQSRDGRLPVLLVTSDQHIKTVFIALLIIVLSCLGAQAKDKDIKAPSGDLPVKIEADSMAYDQLRDVYMASGNVIITYGNSVLNAATVEYDRKNNLATAEGGAFLKKAEDSLQGDKIVVNVEDETGIAYRSKAFFARNHFYIKGDTIEKTGENTYVITKPVATTCDGDNPDWQVAGEKMSVTVDGYGWLTQARLSTKNVPVFYTPIIAFPAKTDRQTGFLLPYLSYSKNKSGMDIEIPFFWAINPHLDATLYSNYIQKRGYKQAAEFRYFAGSQTFGTLYGEYLEDNKHVTENGEYDLQRDWQGMNRRWSYYFNSETKFDSQFYVRTDLIRVSDHWYFRDFDSHNYYLNHFSTTKDDPFEKVSFQGNRSMRFLESTARLYKGWDNYNITARTSYIDDLAKSNNNETLQKYPEIILTGIQQPILSTPAYFSFTSTYDYYYRNEGAMGHYFEVAPVVSLPVKLSNYAYINPQIILRELYWSRNDDQTTSDNRNGDRTFYNANISIGSRIFRVFDIDMFGWDKIRHDIKPEILYSYSPGVHQDNVPDFITKNSYFFDPLASYFSSSNALTERDAVAWALTNTLTTRLKDNKGYLQLLRLKFYQMYDINEAKREVADETSSRRPFSSIGLEADFNPHKYLSFAVRNIYSPYAGWTSTYYDMVLQDWRNDKLTLGYHYTRDSIDEISLNLAAMINKRLSGNLIITQDLLNSRTIENTVGFTYTEQCWAFGMDYIKTHDDQRVVLKIALNGLGKLGFK